MILTRGGTLPLVKKILGTNISVIVCTYNRSGLLKGCIDSLVNQTLEKSKYEVIIVDNNSKDNTAQLVSSYLDLGNVRYVFEGNPGLSYARNRGMEEANSDYLAFIDDDAEAAPDWLESAANLIDNLEPQLDCLGGPYHPLYSQEKPKWFKDKYEIRGFGDNQKFLNASQHLSGSNMIWYKQSLKSVGGFDINLGVVGDELKLGEETRAFESLWILKKDAKIYYSPDLIIYHLVPEYKMRIDYRLKRKFAQGQYNAYINLEGKRTKVKDVFLTFISLIKSFLRFLSRIFSHSDWQNWVIEDGGNIAFQYGKLLKYIGIEPKNIQERLD